VGLLLLAGGLLLALAGGAPSLTSISLGQLPDGTLQVLAYGKDGNGQNAVWVGTQAGPNGAFLPLPTTAPSWQAIAM